MRSTSKINLFDFGDCRPVQAPKSPRHDETDPDWLRSPELLLPRESRFGASCARPRSCLVSSRPRRSGDAPPVKGLHGAYGTYVAEKLAAKYLGTPGRGEVGGASPPSTPR